ncbi:hypothetical protein C5167_012271 [Papaver somniferum]|uniref:SNF2 N-terminal domain-containing protein n=1 Tax=Papaver somniferum TaxID=3469 RepID=A0A4Y7J056_PAPSO|nr:hypothetical protein C5167_012271 [Papaver somniferum]
MPPKKELILGAELSSKQKEYYKAILTWNYEVLTRKGGGKIDWNPQADLQAMTRAHWLGQTKGRAGRHHKICASKELFVDESDEARKMLDRDRVGVKEATVNDAVDDGILLKSFKLHQLVKVEAINFLQ